MDCQEEGKRKQHGEKDGGKSKVPPHKALMVPYHAKGPGLVASTTQLGHSFLGSIACQG